jgi:hypothetical protein
MREKMVRLEGENKWEETDVWRNDTDRIQRTERLHDCCQGVR